MQASTFLHDALCVKRRQDFKQTEIFINYQSTNSLKPPLIILLFQTLTRSKYEALLITISSCMTQGICTHISFWL